MNLRPCGHQPEIQDLLLSGHWPAAAPADLQAHAAVCRSCRDHILLHQAFSSARATTMAAAAQPGNLPAPGLLWWRAQLRRRNAALQRITRPLLGAQLFALALTLIVAAGFTLSQARHGLEWLSALRQSPAFHVQTLLSPADLTSGSNLLYLIPAVAMLLLLSALVVYLATDKQ